MKKKLILIFILFLFVIPNVNAEIFWDGRFYQQSLLAFRGNWDNITPAYIGFSMLDLKLDASPSEMVRVRSEIQYTLLHQKSGIFSVGNGSSAINVNSLNVGITPGDFKLTFGRFLPAWGKARVFRPLDIFIPQTYFLNVLSYPGMDGFSVKYYSSDLSSIEILAIPSMDVRHIMPKVDFSSNSLFLSEINHAVVAMNAEIHIGSFDNNIILLNDNGSPNNLVGLTFKGDAVVGLWSELYYNFNTKTKKDSFKVSVGADYSFSKYYFMSAEYFYDKSGMKDYKKYHMLMELIPRMTFGQQYLMADFNIMTYMEMNYGLTYLGNLQDNSFVLFPYYRYEILENCILGLSLYHFNGKGGREFSPTLLGNYIFNTYLVVRF